MDKKFNIKEWKDTHLNESAKDIYLQDLATPLEDAMGKLKIDSLGDVTTIKQFLDLVKAMEKTGEAPFKFFSLRIEKQIKLLSQAERYI